MSNMQTDINLVLAEYEDAAARGSGRLAEWIERHPEHMELLTEFALESAVLREGSDPPFSPIEEAAMLERAKRVARNTVAAPDRSLPSLLAAARNKGFTPQTFADQIGLGLAMLAKLERRLIQASTIPRALIGEISRALDVRASSVSAYLRQSPALSGAASYKSSNTPQALQESFSTALAACPDMTVEQKQRWSGETDLLCEGY